MIDPTVIDEAFAKVSHAFPHDADWQGPHFRYAVKNGVTLIEIKRSVFIPQSECGHCGQHRGTKTTRYFYWLLIGERYYAVHASEKIQVRTTSHGEELFLTVHQLPATNVTLSRLRKLHHLNRAPARIGRGDVVLEGIAFPW